MNTTNGHGERIVLIDDDPVYRRIMKRAAKMADIDVDIYESLMDLGSVGLLANYDVAIVDYHLEAMTGVEIGEYLASMMSGKPMILVSRDRLTDSDKSWPSSIKKFMNKDEGYTNVLNEARKLALQS